MHFIDGKWFLPWVSCRRITIDLSVFTVTYDREALPIGGSKRQPRDRFFHERHLHRVHEIYTYRLPLHEEGIIRGNPKTQEIA